MKNNLPDIDFEEVDILKRERDVEGSIGVWLRVTDKVYLHTLCKSDANPRFRTHGPRMLREINRRANAGATPEDLDELWADFHFQCVLLGWKGVETRQAGEIEPQPVEFTRLNYIAWAVKHPRIRLILENYSDDETNFRRSQADGVADELKN